MSVHCSLLRYLVCCIFIHTLLLVYFFFFKQKTAYEIKECDWSSDVCSSDLFKKEAVQLITEQGYGVTEAARNLGINAGMLGR